MATRYDGNSSPVSAAIPYIYTEGEGEVRWMGDVRSCFLARGRSTNDGFCLVDERASKGEAVPLHRHPADMESFYVLDGELALYIENNSGVRLGRGAFAYVPAGVVHGFRIESASARYLLLTTPHHGEFYRAITIAARSDGSHPDEPVTRDMIETACARFGVEFVASLPDN